MELYHAQAHKEEFQETKHLMYDYGSYSRSFQEPCTQEFHRTYFAADYDQTKRTIRNHIS